MYFSDYMQEWLYGDEGYYKNFKAIGKDGDFYTAVSTSPFFGASIANYLWQRIQDGSIPRDALLLEIGSHQGHLIGDMIQWLFTCDPTLIESMRFAIVERQPKLQEAQRRYFIERFGDDVTIEQYSSLAQLDEKYAFVVSNEIFDAFPCELLKEKQIATVQEHTILWEDAPQDLLKRAERHHLNRGEIAIGYEDFAQEIEESFMHCDFLSFDYGEKYVRNDFSIRIYKQHETLPLFDEELQLANEFQKSDITYDVNFQDIMDSFGSLGFELVHYETQARALVRFGLIEMLEDFAKQTTQAIYLREVDKIKTLLAPTMMGDKFKLIHLKK